MGGTRTNKNLEWSLVGHLQCHSQEAQQSPGQKLQVGQPGWTESPRDSARLQLGVQVLVTKSVLFKAWFGGTKSGPQACPLPNELFPQPRLFVHDKVLCSPG